MQQPNQKRSCVFISGPYSGGASGHGPQGYMLIEKNVFNARKAMAELVRLGYFVFCAHTHSEHFEVITPEIGIDFWYELDLYFLQFCHALLRLDGESHGADKEVEFCLDNDIPVFYTIKDLAVNIPVFLS